MAGDGRARPRQHQASPSPPSVRHAAMLLLHVRLLLALQVGGFQTLAGTPTTASCVVGCSSAGSGRYDAAEGSSARSNGFAMDSSCPEYGGDTGGQKRAGRAAQGGKTVCTLTSRDVAPGAWRRLVSPPAASAAPTGGVSPASAHAEGSGAHVATSVPCYSSWQPHSVFGGRPGIGEWVRDEEVAANTACMVEALFAAASSRGEAMQPVRPPTTGQRYNQSSSSGSSHDLPHGAVAAGSSSSATEEDRGLGLGQEAHHLHEMAATALVERASGWRASQR